MADFTTLLVSAKIARSEVQDLLDRVDAGVAGLDEGVDRSRAVELLNGTIEDYNQIIKRLARSKYA